MCTEVEWNMINNVNRLGHILRFIKRNYTEKTKDKDCILPPCDLNFLCFSGTETKLFLLQCFGLSTKTCYNYLGPAKDSTHKRPEREDGQAHSQHGAVEETHHLGAAQVNTRHYLTH